MEPFLSVGDYQLREDRFACLESNYTCSQQRFFKIVGYKNFHHSQRAQIKKTVSNKQCLRLLCARPGIQVLNLGASQWDKILNAGMNRFTVWEVFSCMQTA